jgi:5-methylthioadenosine/S-adenosylhomocysteine deaminase
MRTVIRADLALTMDVDLGVVERPELVIDEGRIVSLRSVDAGDAPDGMSPTAGGAEEVDVTDGAASPADEPRGEDVWELDLPGRFLLPGLVNSHTHAAMTLLRGYADDLPLKEWLEERIWPAERHVDVDDVRAGTLLAAAEMLAAGVTTFADMYLHMDGVAEAVERSGIRAVLAHGMFSALGPVDETVEDVADFVRRWHGAADGRISAMFAPHAIYTCTPELLREAAAAARDLGVGLHTHLAETKVEVEQVRAEHGASPVQVAADTGVLDAGALAAHCVWVDDHDIDLLVDAGTGVAHNPRSNMKLASGVAPVGRLLGAGLDVGLGTDGAASTNQVTMFEEMRTASLLQKVSRDDPSALPAEDVLRMATIGGARAVGLDDHIGSLTPGKRADVVVLRLDRPGTVPWHDPWSAVVYSAQDQDAEWVFCDGRAGARDGRPLEFELPALREDVQRRARRIAEAAGRS